MTSTRSMHRRRHRWTSKHRDMLRAWLDTVPVLVAEPARDELVDIARLTETINELAKRSASVCV